MGLRRLLNFTLRALLLALIFVQLAYLLRRPLGERWLCDKVARLASDALGGEVHIARLRGDWLTTVIAEGVQVRSAGVLRLLADGDVSVQVDLRR